MTHTLTLWTNNVEHARWADAAGVDRVGLDLESFGKAHRQSGLDTWISRHSVDDLGPIRAVLRRAAFFVRADPINEGSRTQIETLIDAGVDVIMAPNFTTLEELVAFAAIVDGRAALVPLIERVAAVECIAGLPQLGVREIHVGLNDLSIELEFANRLKVLTEPIMRDLADKAHEAGLRLGVGGLGRAHDEALPVASDLVYAQQARLGSTGALIARSFFSVGMTEIDFTREIATMRERLEWWSLRSPHDLEVARRELARQADATLL